jgi:hypothetical protein
LEEGSSRADMDLPREESGALDRREVMATEAATAQDQRDMVLVLGRGMNRQCREDTGHPGHRCKDNSLGDRLLSRVRGWGPCRLRVGILRRGSSWLNSGMPSNSNMAKAVLGPQVRRRRHISRARPRAQGRVRVRRRVIRVELRSARMRRLERRRREYPGCLVMGGDEHI